MSFSLYNHNLNSTVQLPFRRVETRLLIPIFLVLATIAHAIVLNPIGPGGGGWLYAGAFDPVDERFMLIGTDMSGVFRTVDGGRSWEPWNMGLISDRPSALDQISYIQDLIVIRHDNDPVEYYAATLGGMYRAFESGIWENDTPNYLCNYTNNEYGDTINDVSIPFSCLAYNGEGILYAGAGANRVGYEHPENWFGAGLESYPGLGDWTDVKLDAFQYCTFRSATPYNAQYTVWMKDLNNSNTWLPIQTSVDMGSARDISVARIDGVDYIVVCTVKGIWLFNGSDWRNVCEDSLYDHLNVEHVSGYYRNNLLCWNVYLTKRGTLYAGMHVHRAEGNSIPGGVYRMSVVPTNPDESFHWFWVGSDNWINNDDASAPPALEHTMDEIGLITRWVKCYPALNETLDVKTGAVIWLINVIEGADNEPDVILAGGRVNSYYSMVRGVQPYALHSDTTAYQATWSSRVYKHNGSAYMYRQFGAPADSLEVGHLSFWGTEVIFQPVVFPQLQPGSIPQAEIPSLVQFNGMVHRSDDAGLTWDNIYGDWEAGGWSGRGYDEMQTHDLDFHSDGRLIEAAQDDGIYSSTNIVHSSWRRHPTPRNRSNSGTGVEVCPTSTGIDYLMATVGSYGSNDKIIIKEPGSASWDTVVVSVGNLPTDFGIDDIELISPSLCFATYNYSIDGTHRAYGVIRGTRQEQSNWSWSHVDASPLLTLASEDTLSNGCKMDLEYMQSTGRLFCAIGAKPKIYMLSSTTATSWDSLMGPWHNSPEFSGYNIYEMASDNSGSNHTLVFGISPQNLNSPAFVFRSDNADAEPEDMIWYRFPLAITSNEAAQIKTVAISPYNSNTMYFGINYKGSLFKNLINIGCLHANTGLWRLDITGSPGQWTHQWTYEFSGTMAEGIVVEDLAFNPQVEGQLVIATGGQGLYYSQVPPSSMPLAAKYVNKSTSVVGLDYSGIPYSEITLDYDNDGRDDLLVTQQYGGPPRLYRNAYDGINGTPHMNGGIPAFDNTINGLNSSRGCSAADYDNDGNTDLFIAHASYPMLLRNIGPGYSIRFVNYGPMLTYEEPDHTIHYTLENSWAGSWIDLDMNGSMDLLVTRADAPGVNKLEATHTKLPFAPLVNNSNSVITQFILMPQLFGSSSTEPVTASSVAVADIDGDGRSEVLLPSLGDACDTRLYRRSDQPYFYNEFTDRFPGIDLGGVDAAVWADLNRDMHPDLVASARYNGAVRLRLFMNDALNPGTFSERTAWADAIGPTTDLRAVDTDLDGWIDIVAVADSTTTQPGIHMLRNTGAAGLSGGFPYFQDVTAEAGFTVDTERVSGMVAADFLADGDVDLLLGRELVNQSFYYSATASDGVTEPPPSHWLGVRLLVGSGANNRSGIGTEVTVQTGSNSTTQMIDGGSGLGGQHCASLRFGLGDYIGDVTVQTRWPGGFVQTNSYTTSDTVLIIEDKTDPTVIASSLQTSVYYCPDRTLLWVQAWDTAYSYAPDCDRVQIAAPGLSAHTYAPGDAGVTATSGRKSDGSYWHRFEINGVRCDDGNYVYTVISDTHAPQYTEHTTATGNYMSYFCAHGGGDPNVEE